VFVPVEWIKCALGRQLDGALAQLTDCLQMSEGFDIRILFQPRLSRLLGHSERFAQWRKPRAVTKKLSKLRGKNALMLKRGPHVGELDVTGVELGISMLFTLRFSCST
jgi:hypothetical protein